MLELQDFISESMTSIIRGIQTAQETDVGDHIAPLIQGEKRNDLGNFHLKGDDQNQATIVQFDVQVAAKQTKSGDEGAKGGVKLYVVDMELGANAQVANEASNIQRLKFAVPLKIPKRKN